MLTIRTAQMEALQEHRDRQFVVWLAAFVREREGPLVAGWSDAELERGVAAAWRRADRYGMTDPLALSEFFKAMAAHAPNFDTHHAIQPILRDEAIGPNHRIHAVWSLTTAETWAEVDQGRDRRMPFPPRPIEAG